MKSDRELLELAAKAYGFGDPEGSFIWTESEYPRGSKTSGALWNYIGWCDTAELWNPLTDDGDALRLAVTCKIALNPTLVDGLNRDLHESAAGGVNRWTDCREKHNGDPFAATRRAIVRAAAKIGRVM